MTFVNRKYFGTLTFNKVYCKLINVARNQKKINYIDVANIMGLSPGEPMGNHWQKETGQILGEISDYEYNHDRPMLSAVVVRKKNGEPGPGFSKLAVVLGKKSANSDIDEKTFWEQELNKVYNVWE